jgi:hypothetical protein
VELLHICVRRTLPWHDEAAVAASLDPIVRGKVELWNATFQLTYAAFRHRMTQIARENWSRVEHAQLTPREQIPPGALVAPVDDDDWFSPEMGRRLLAERSTSLHGYHWNRYLLETPRRPRRWPFARSRRATDTSRYTCSSNNYAVVNLPELELAIGSHVAASRIFDARPGRVKHVAASLSLQCRNLASRSALGNGLRFAQPGAPPPPFSPETLIEKLRRQREFYDRLRLPPEVAWAEPSAAAVAELLREMWRMARGPGPRAPRSRCSPPSPSRGPPG